MVGKNGLSEQVIEKAAEALAAHELIKVRFVEFKEEKKVLTPKLAEATESHVAGILGHVAILYKPSEDASKRRIVLPTRPAKA